MLAGLNPVVIKRLNVNINSSHHLILKIVHMAITEIE
jgi:hypothetical protein